MRRRKVFSKLGRQGQLAIFIIFIFQVVFVFFAMSLNVALVVHDKINLQNSVDLAAYYGAMKQAESLNVIAHINYQIRQSWKLLAWRYRVLGNLPAVRRTLGYSSGNTDESQLLLPHTHSNSANKGYVICLNYTSHSDPGWGWGIFSDPKKPIDNSFVQFNSPIAGKFCKDIDMTIEPFPTVSPVGAWQAFVDNMNLTIQNANIDIEHKCTIGNYTNWLFALFSYYHFRMDQSKKEKLIYKIANEIIKQGREFYQSPQLTIERGVKNTLESNLTYINKTYFNTNEFKTYNSLEGKDPNTWLKPKSFYALAPIYTKMEKEAVLGNSSVSNCKSSPGHVLRHIPPLNPINANLGQLAQQLRHFSSSANLCNDSTPHICNPSAGLSKDPDFIVYYGVKAEVNYQKQIFQPFTNGLTLKAQAFAKPFGGRIGPAVRDSLLPQINPPSNTDLQTIMSYMPNYSKYPGDTLGLTSFYVHSEWADRLYHSPRANKSIRNYIPQQITTIINSYGSPLAKSDSAKQWEIAAVAPDLFDVTYFSIMPSYMETYFPILEDIFGTGKIPRDFDNGPAGASGQAQGIRRQLAATKTTPDDGGKDVWPLNFNTTNPAFRTLDKPFYVIKELDHLLTGWNPPKTKYTQSTNYGEIGTSYFGECTTWDTGIATNPKNYIANGCVLGGRTGYSVKMVSKAALAAISAQGMPNWP